MDYSLMFHSLFKVIIAGVVLGAGIPALFAIGVRVGSGTSTHPAGTVGKAISFLCFALIAAAVLIGILWITKASLYQYFAWDLFGTEAAG